MTEKQSMRAVAITAFGGPDRLTLMQMPRPIPGPDEILIRVQAARVGLWDVKARRGQVGDRSFPLILGWESAGIIEQTGAHVTGLQVADAVYCYVQHVGHYAESIAAPALLVARRPSTIDATHAAAIPINGAPQSSPMWFLWDGEYIKLTHTTDRQKYHNITRDPRVSLSIMDVDEPYTFAEFRGVVERIEEDPTGAFYLTLAEHYGVLRGRPGDSRVILSVKIQHIVGQNL